MTTPHRPTATALYDGLTNETAAYSRGIAAGLILASSTPNTENYFVALVTNFENVAIGAYLTDTTKAADAAAPNLATMPAGKKIVIGSTPRHAMISAWAELNAANQWSPRDFLVGTDAANDTGIVISICHESEYTPASRGEFISGMYEALRLVAAKSQ